MQDINLLQNKLKDTAEVWQKRNKIFVMIFVIVILAEIGFFASLMILNNKTKANLESVKSASAEIQTNINVKQPDLSHAKAFQAQLKNLRFVTEAHIYWSRFFDELSAFTFNKATYANIAADIQGKVHLEGRIATYKDLGKLILGISTSDKFKNVRLRSSLPTTGDFSGYSFSLDLEAVKDVFNNK